jgi:hypothetical protein
MYNNELHEINGYLIPSDFLFVYIFHNMEVTAGPSQGKMKTCAKSLKEGY